MDKKRPPIPPDILLQIRQKCKFGCVICGCPVYDYDHLLEEWSQVHDHKEENLFLLCPSHHREKTNGIISKETIVRKFNELNRKQTTPRELYLEDFKLIFGNNIINSFSGNIFNILNKDYLELKTDKDSYLLNSKIYNKDGKIAFSINNSAYSCYVQIWDINFVGKTITFRNKKYDKFLEITLDGENKEIKVTGKFYIDSKNYIWIKNDGIFYKNHCLASNCNSEKSLISGFTIIDKISTQVSGVGFYNCLEMYKCISKDNNVAFAWDTDFLYNIK